jgi:hypothetical protein
VKKSNQRSLINHNQSETEVFNTLRDWRKDWNWESFKGLKSEDLLDLTLDELKEILGNKIHAIVLYNRLHN